MSHRRARLLSEGPAVAAWMTIAVLSLAGLRSVFGGTPRPVNAGPAVTEPRDAEAEGVAVAFARAYVGERAPDASLRRLVERAGALERQTPADIEAAWVTGSRPTSRELRTVHVAVSDRQLGVLHLAVSVARRPRGELAVAGAPALVGGPRLASESLPLRGRPVSDAQLAEMLGRALTNYLAGDARDLRADLAPGSTLSLPALRLEPEVPPEFIQLAYGQIAVRLIARGPEGTRWPLAYRLSVRHAGRWVLTAIDDQPTRR